jgi:hypothetical protein
MAHRRSLRRLRPRRTSGARGGSAAVPESAPDRAKRVERCRGRTGKQGKVVNLQPMRPPAAPAKVRLSCPSRSVRSGSGCVVEDDDAVTLQWEDRSNNEAGFSIYVRGSGLAGSDLCTPARPQEQCTRWVRVATLPPGATSWRTSKASALQAAGVIRGAGQRIAALAICPPPRGVIQLGRAVGIDGIDIPRRPLQGRLRLLVADNARAAHDVMRGRRVRGCATSGVVARSTAGGR